MDFQNMKRKELQALCKKHGILANKTNLEMATLLASILKVSESENTVSETKDEEEEESVAVNCDNNEKKSKKVRFSPDVETREYEPSVYKGRGGRISRKRNVVDLKEKKVVVKSGIFETSEEKLEVGNRRRLGKREVVDEEVGAKKRRVSAVYKGNLGGIRGKNVMASEVINEFGEEIEGRSDELGKEGGERFVGRNVSRRKSVVPRKNDEKKAVEGNILESEEKSEKVSLEIETLKGMKRKELQFLCKKHGIPANKTNLEMSRLLAAILKVSQETGSSQRFGSAIDASETHGEIERKEQFNEEELSGDNEGDCVEVLWPWGNEEVVGNIGALIEKENLILREENVLATEGAFLENISVVKQAIQETKLMTPEATKSMKKTKGYKSRSNRKIRDLGDGPDGLSDMKKKSDSARCVEESQNSTHVVDELPRSQSKLVSFSSANQPGHTGSEKGMEKEEISSATDSQLENRDHSSDNDCSIQVESKFGGEIEGRSDELGKEGREGLVGRNVLRRKSVVPRKNEEKKADKSVEGNILESEEKSEKVRLENETLQGMKRKELQSLCKKHGIPANKTNLEMSRLLAAILKVSQETGSSQRFGSSIDASETHWEIERMEQLNEEEFCGDNEGGCVEEPRACGNEEGVGNVGELIEEEKVILREESILATEAAVTETISMVKEPSGDNEGGCVEESSPCCNEEGIGNVGELIEEENVNLREQSILATEAAFTETNSMVKEPIQDTKWETSEVTKSVKKAKEYESTSNRKIRDLVDGLDGLSDATKNFDNAQCVEENQNLTPEVDEFPSSETTLSSCSSANQPGLTGLEKGMEVEEVLRGKDSQHENRDFNDRSTENDCAIQVESNVHPWLDDIEAIANLEVGHNGRTLDAEEISCTVQETKDNERDIGLILQSNNDDLEQVELSDEKEGNNASANGAYEEASHSQNCGDCSTETREFKDILDGRNHNACETISELDIPQDISKEQMDQKERMALESYCSFDAAPVMGVVSSEDLDVDTHVEELTVQGEDLGSATWAEIVVGNSYKEVSPSTHSRGEPIFKQTFCDGFEVSRMEIIDSAVAPNDEFPAKTMNSENLEVQDATKSGIKEVYSYLNENSDKRASQNIHDESKFSEEWSVEQLEEKESEFEFVNSQASDFTQSIHDNMVERESAEKHGHYEDINGEAIDNGTHKESPKTLCVQQAPNGSSSSPCMLGLLFPDEREEFTPIQSAAPETLLGSLSEDSKDPIGTSETVNDSLEINLEKYGQLDNFMKNSIEMNEDMFVYSEDVTSGNIKPVDALEIVENMDELAEELTTPQALTSNKKPAEKSFTEEIQVHSKSCGKSEKMSIDSFSDLKDHPFYETAELENETSDVAASALARGNREYNDEEEPTIDAQQESRRSEAYVPVMPITQNVTDLERLETIVIENQRGNASLTDRDEPIHADDEISSVRSNVSVIKKEHIEQVRDKSKNVEIEHSFEVEGTRMEASVGAIVADKLNFSPAVDSIDRKGDIDASNDKHDIVNQLSEIDDGVKGGFSWSDVNFSTPSELTSEDKNKGCVMGTNAAPFHNPDVEDSAAFQNKETMDFEGFHLISSSKPEIVVNSSAIYIVNASQNDREQEVEKPAIEAQQLSLMNKDVMEIQEKSKMNAQTAGELEAQHGESLYSAEETVAAVNMTNSHDVSELLHIQENEHSSMQDNLPLEIDGIPGSCLLEDHEESVKVETKNDDFSGRLGVNELKLSEDVEPGSSVLDQSVPCVNAAAGREITSELEDQHGQNVQLEDRVIEEKMYCNHDASESLHNIDGIEQCDVTLKGVEIQRSCSPETHKDEDMKVEWEKNEIGDGSRETLWSEHNSPLNATVGEGGSGDVERESSGESRVVAKEEEEEGMKMKRRSVLIHGTPKRAFEMKENIVSTKTAANLTVLTALPKRRPLKDLTKI